MTGNRLPRSKIFNRYEYRQMSTNKISADDKALLAGWVEFGDGVHATRSPQIIQQALKNIQRQHIFCVVVTKGYESGKLALVEFGNGRILLDKPTDWPPRMAPQPMRIIFKDQSQIWNQFAVKLLEVTGDSLVTSMPLKYVRLQRRDNYRVEVPSNSRAGFRHGDRVYADFAVLNISANGTLLCSEQRQRLPVGDLLKEISLHFPVEGGKPVRVDIKEGRVVREAESERREPCYGVHFLLRGQEDRFLMQYVRLRERELLRKGMADES